MNVFEHLLSKRWILKADNPELYFQIRDELTEIRKFVSEKLGYQVIVNPHLIRMEKLPAKAENWMGITEFKDTLEYSFLCMVLMFLDDKGAGEQFVLSALTEFIAAQFREITVDWTLYHHRRCLVKVLKFCASNGMIRVNDGSDEGYAKDMQTEVLYENTGISHYFMRNFTREVSANASPSDFSREEWFDMNEDRGIVRRHRVYRNLLMNPGFYLEDDNEEDYVYIKMYRKMIESDLSAYLDVDLQVYKSGAYLVQGPDNRMGRFYPEENTMSDIILFLGSLIHEELKKKNLTLSSHEKIILSKEGMRKLLEKLRKRNGAGFAKTYREMLSEEFCKTVYDHLLMLGFIKEEGDRVVLYPVLGRVTAVYPKEFTEGGAKHVKQ